MDARRIVYVTYIASTQDAVWNALTNPDVTQLYWYGTRVESDWKVGSKVVYRRGGEVTDEHIVLAVDPPHSFRHSFHPVFAEEFRKEDPSRVTFAIEQSGGVVRLTLIHDEFPLNSRIIAGCRESWPPIISSLKSLLETGKPLPTINFPPVPDVPFRVRSLRTKPQTDASVPPTTAQQ
jgi:uncharacterized protein YndB with AHSA1/START domain